MTAGLLISPQLLRLFVLTQGRRKPPVSICNLTVLTHVPRPRGKWLKEKGEDVGLKLTFAPERLMTEIWIKERKGVGERKKLEDAFVGIFLSSLPCKSAHKHAHTTR